MTLSDDDRARELLGISDELLRTFSVEKLARYYLLVEQIAVALGESRARYRTLVKRLLDLIEGDGRPIEHGDGETTDGHWCNVCRAFCPVGLLSDHAPDCEWVACVREAHALLGTEPGSVETGRRSP